MWTNVTNDHIINYMECHQGDTEMVIKDIMNSADILIFFIVS